MATIMEDLKTEVALKNRDYASKVRAAGFPAVAIGYPVITERAIGAYLLSVAEKTAPLNIFGKKKSMVDVGDLEEREKPALGFRLSIRFNGEAFGKRIRWIETPVRKFPAMPPEHVLDRVAAAKKDFDEIRIVTIDVQEIHDPLVVGIKKGDNKNRYLIDWWDNDIDPTELAE